MKNLVLYDISNKITRELREALMDALSLEVTHEIDILREEYALGTKLGKEYYAFIDPNTYGPILDKEYDAPDIYKIFNSKFKRSTHQNFLFFNYPKTPLQLDYFEKLHQEYQASFWVVQIIVPKDVIYQDHLKGIPEGVERGLEGIKHLPWSKERVMELYQVNNDQELREHFRKLREKGAVEAAESTEKRNQSINELMKNHPLLKLAADISDKKMLELIWDFCKQH